MWVEEITIDGFKSFARRTTVPGLDPQFNAITGLNGSGKSNILDSICFVLGITNMQQVSGAFRNNEATAEACSCCCALCIRAAAARPSVRLEADIRV